MADFQKTFKIDTKGKKAISALNAAEILHILYYTRQGYKLFNTQMGGTDGTISVVQGDKIVKKVFRTCLKRVLEDIIDNNVTFELPTGSRKSELHMRRISGEKFSRCRKNGKFQEIDFLQSFFAGYEIELNMYKKGGLKRSKTVYVDPKLKQKIIDNTNNGK
jgi:hypothetical protein